MPGFLKYLWSTCRYACNNQWCDIDCVQLVKQVLWLLPAFNYFIRHLLSIKWIGMAILTQHIVNACQRKQGNTVLATNGLPKTEAFNFIVIILA